MFLGNQQTFKNIFLMPIWIITTNLGKNEPELSRNLNFYGLIKNKQPLKAKEGILPITLMGKCQYIQSMQLWEWTDQRKGQSWMILIQKCKTNTIYSEDGGTERLQGIAEGRNAEIHSAL